MTLSAPFKVEVEEKRTTIIGYGKRQREAFFKLISTKAKKGKMYQLKLVEVTAAEVHKNYMFLCLSLAAEQLGFTEDGLRADIEDRVLYMAIDTQDDYFKREDWVTDVVDIETSEVKKQVIKHMSKWTVSMMNDFIEVLRYMTLKMIPEFKFPESKDFKGEVKGMRNEVIADDITVIEFNN